MPQVELYINNKLMDLQGDESIEVDYSVFDINKIGTRGGARSYEFEIPKTNRNKEVLENPEIINNLSNLPYSRMDALALVDGVDMLIRFAEIQSVKDFYRVRLYGANVSFYELIRDLFLEDLSNVCDYQHHWIYDNVVGSRSNTSGYIYPLVDWHTDAPNAFISDTLRQIEVSKMLPCLFVEELIQKIVEDSGYEYQNSAPSDEVMILPCSVKPKRKAKPSLYEGAITSSRDMQLQTSPEGTFSEFWYLGWASIDRGCSSYWSPFLTGFPEGTNEIPFANKISFKVEWVITIENTSPNPFNASIVFTTDRGTCIFPAARNSNNYHEEFFTLASGDTVTLTGECNLITDSATDITENSHYLAVWIAGVFKDSANLYINQKGSSTITISEVQVLKENDAVDYLDFALAGADVNTFITVGGMWDIKQIDLIKEYCKILGLMIIVDDVNKKVIFEKFDKVIANISKAVDWSNKLDESEDPELVFIGGSYGQNSNFTWESDDPEAKQAGTDGTILIDNKNLEKDVDVVEMEYASSYFKTLLNGLDIPTIPVYQSGTPENDLTQRILYLKKYTSAELDPTGDLTYYRDGTLIPPLVISSDIPIAWFINKSQENNLGFANNILESRYAALSTIIPRFKNIKLFIRLNAADINQLDFIKPIWIQKYESYFYLSSIKGFSYTESRSTLVELVKLNING